MKAKTREKLVKAIGELEMVQNSLEQEKEYADYDDVGSAIDLLQEVLKGN